MKQTILRPDFVEYSNDGKIVSTKKFDDGILRVVYIQQRNVYVIVSVYYL